MSTIAIKPATHEDIPLLHDMASDIWRASYPGIISASQIEYMLDTMYSPEIIAREMDSGVVWELVVADEQPIGYVSYHHEPSVPRIKLDKLYLATSRQGHGIARVVLDHVKRAAIDHAARTIWLQVNKNNNRAIRAYERFGFRISDSIVCDIGGGFVMDDYVMTIEVGARAGS